MTRLQEAIGLGLVLGIFHGMMQPLKKCPCSAKLYKEQLDD